MPLFDTQYRNAYSLRGRSESVLRLLQATRLLQTGPAVEAGWAQVISDLVQMKPVDRTLVSTQPGTGILAPGVAVEPPGGWFLTLLLADPPQKIGVEPVGGGEEVLVDVVHCDFLSDDLFAWLLATAVLAVPGAEFTLRYGSSENWRAPQPELVLARYLIERADGMTEE